ncbi:MAG: exopolysaccharide biosynthesis protein [Proteobacteria bacterium]|nr:exopolysaccharide biosynthesis protein [Pseudomonadota bacterium]
MTDAAVPAIRPLSRLISDLRQEVLRAEKVNIGFLADALHERGFGVLILVFAGPMALPLPVPPGINLILALPLVFLTAQQALGRHRLWMPEKLLRKPMPKDKMTGLLGGMVPWFEKIELLVRPRMGWITQDGPSRVFGALGLVMALTACLPIPMTHSVPSMGLVLMAVGTLMRDGLAVVAGAIVGIGWIGLLAGAVIFIGPEAFDIIRETVRSVL